MTQTETIFALSTAPGRAGVAIVRVSGPASWASLRVLSGGVSVPEPRMTALRTLKHPDTGTIIDRAMVIGFIAPASFTGEDIIEYHIHGGRAVTDSLLAALSTCHGHRLAEPGEFTRRAFENGRMDLTEAEAIADLIHAETALQQEQALAQMGGSLSRIYDEWTRRLTAMLAHLEADIDFPDEDLPDGVSSLVQPQLATLRAEITAHLSDNRRGEILRDGVKVAVVGAPNAGKSSLVNALAQRDVAIVSDIAGTTRDVIEVHLDIGGYPVIVADTAGLRPDQIGATGHDAIEGEGIKRALAWARAADLLLLIYDAASLPALDPHTKALEGAKSLRVFNKADLATADIPAGGIVVSAQSGQGLDDLTQGIKARIDSILGQRGAPAPTRQRHRAALEEAVQSLTRALIAPAPELAAEDARIALRALGRITGRVDVEDILDRIFRDFCIGK